MSGPGIGPVATPRRERDCESTVTTFNSSVLLAKKIPNRDIALDHFQSTAVVVLDLLFSGHSSRLDSLPLFFELLPCFVSAFQSVTLADLVRTELPLQQDVDVVAKMF